MTTEKMAIEPTQDTQIHNRLKGLIGYTQYKTMLMNRILNRFTFILRFRYTDDIHSLREALKGAFIAYFSKEATGIDDAMAFVRLDDLEAYTNTLHIKKAQRIAGKVKKVITERLGNCSKGCRQSMTNTLHHELGHYFVALLLGYTVSSMRVGKWFVVPQGDGHIQVFDVERIGKEHKHIRKLFKKAKKESKGECYMHTNAIKSVTEMALEMYAILAGGAHGTAQLAHAVHIADKPLWRHKLIMWNLHRHNPIKQLHPKRYAWKTRKGSRNDQSRMEDILQSPWTAIEMNEEFKVIAKGGKCKKASNADLLHAALIKHIKTPSH